MNQYEFNRLKRGDSIHCHNNNINFIVHNVQQPSKGIVVAVRTEVICFHNLKYFSVNKREKPISHKEIEKTPASSAVGTTFIVNIAGEDYKAYITQKL